MPLQLNVVDDPAVMLVALAVKLEIVGAEPVGIFDEVYSGLSDNTSKSAAVTPSRE